jgi:type I restriction enzyme S subunit
MSELIPKLRFPSYTTLWDITSIGSLVERKVIEKPMDGNHGNIHPKASDYSDDGIPFVMSNNIVDGKLNYSGIKYIPESLAGSLQKGFSTEGDILITHKGTIGATALVAKLKTPYIMLTPQVTYYRVSNHSKLHSLYLLQSFRTPKFQSMMKRLAASGTRPYVGITEQRELLISTPQLEEQQKIADFLTSVDSKISQLSENHHLLKEYKKGVMQQIFNQQIRFKDEDGKVFPDWKTEAIGKYLEPYKELVPASTDLPVLTSSRTGLYIQERSVINEGEYGVVPLGYFTYRHMSDDLIFKFNVNRDYGRGAVSKEYPVFKTVGMDTYFLETKLNEGHEFKRFAIQQKQGGTRTRLYFKNLKELKLALPCLAEQQKIAQFLQSIDNKIDAVTEQIEHTKQFKKGLLQQMFL